MPQRQERTHSTAQQGCRVSGIEGLLLLLGALIDAMPLAVCNSSIDIGYITKGRRSLEPMSQPQSAVICKMAHRLETSDIKAWASILC